MPNNCPTCKGTGMVHTGDTTAFQPTVVSCPDCKGTGEMAKCGHNCCDEDLPCLECNGTGTIPESSAVAYVPEAALRTLARAVNTYSPDGTECWISLTANDHRQLLTDLRAAVAEIERLRGRVVDEEEYSGRLQDLRDSLRVELAAALKRAEEAEDDVRAWREEGRLLVDRACTAERAIADVTRERNEALRELERRGPECECRNRPCDDIACPYKAGCH